MNNRIEALRLLLAKARRKIANAKNNLILGSWEDASSRAYYAAFHAVSSVLLERDLTFSSHGQTLSAFNRECVQKGEFPTNFTQNLTRLYEDKQNGNYSITLVPDEQTARRDVVEAEIIVNACVNFLERKTGQKLNGH